MKQQIIQKALNIVRSRKNRAELEHNLLIEKNLENPEYQDLQKQYTRLMIENARRESEGKGPDKQKENQLKAKLDTFSNLTPKYSCPTCHDDGYVNGQMCVCLKKEISKILLSDSGFQKLENFEDAKKTCGDLKETYALMQKWCNSDFKKNLVYLAGPTGVGKTFLIRCMANELIESGKVVKIVTSFALNQDFKDFSRSHNDDLLNKYINCEVLFIDDLGTEPIYKNITVEFLYLIINERKMRKLPTIITSNLDLSNVREIYDERIYSRIVDRSTSITILLTGQDKRIKK